MDDRRLNDVFTGFKEGKITCGETKNLLVEKLVSLIIQHQKKRSEITNDILDMFYAKDKEMYKKIVSPFDKEIPCFSYPGMTLNNRFMDIVIENMPKQLNAIGTHTRKKKFRRWI